jgi:hypothetical protein
MDNRPIAAEHFWMQCWQSSGTAVHHSPLPYSTLTATQRRGVVQWIRAKGPPFFRNAK